MCTTHVIDYLPFTKLQNLKYLGQLLSGNFVRSSILYKWHSLAICAEVLQLMKHDKSLLSCTLIFLPLKGIIKALKF